MFNSNHFIRIALTSSMKMIFDIRILLVWFFFKSIVKFYFNLDVQPTIQILNLLAILNGPAAVAAVRRFAAAVWCQVLYSSKSGLPNHWPVWPENIVIVQYMSTCSIHIVIFRASQLVRSTFFFWDVICRSPFAGLPICPIPLYSRQGHREAWKIVFISIKL